MCPNCGQSAPIRLGAGGGFCSACGAPRSLLKGAPLSLAGEPQRVGGFLASWFGWFLLISGLLLAVFLGWVGDFLFDTTSLIWYLSVPISILSLLSGGGVLLAGRKLKRRGERSLREARIDALRKAALARGGSITVPQAAMALQTSKEQADKLLTELAIAQNVHQELTDEGELFYSFSRLRAPTIVAKKRVKSAYKTDSDEEVEELEATLEPPPQHQRVNR